MGKPLNVSERGFLVHTSYIHVCSCKGRGHAECAADAVTRLSSVETSKCRGWSTIRTGVTNCASALSKIDCVNTSDASGHNAAARLGSVDMCTPVSTCLHNC